MKLLVVTSESITAQQLRDAVQVQAEPQDIEVMVIAPAMAESPLRFWVSDADAAIEQADAVRAESVAQLRDAGVNADGATGEGDPRQAIIDALQRFPAERIVLFAHADEDDQRYREDIDVQELRETVGLPVDRASIG